MAVADCDHGFLPGSDQCVVCFEVVLDFDLSGHVEDVDAARLSGQLERVHGLMSDGEWRTLHEISGEIGGSEASVSARLRDLRKEEFGGFTVNRKRITDTGLFRYQVIV